MLLPTLVSALINLGLTERWPHEDEVFAKWVNYSVVEQQDQYLVVRIYNTPKFVNVWVDKQFIKNVDEGFPYMGNGFIHKTLYTMEDVSAFMAVIAMAV